MRACGNGLTTAFMRAASCPGCGTPQKKPTGALTKFLGYPIAAGFLLVAIAAMLPSKEHGGTTEVPPVQVATVDKSEAAQKKRAELLQELRQRGLFGEVQCRSQGADVTVKPAFSGLDFGDKQSLVSVAYAYCFDGSDKYIGLNLLDSKTNKKVGTFSAAFGLSLK